MSDLLRVGAMSGERATAGSSSRLNKRAAVGRKTSSSVIVVIRGRSGESTAMPRQLHCFQPQSQQRQQQ